MSDGALLELARQFIDASRADHHVRAHQAEAAASDVERERTVATHFTLKRAQRAVEQFVAGAVPALVEAPALERAAQLDERRAHVGTRAVGATGRISACVSIHGRPSS